jgi:hypothetical protein
MPNGRPFDEQHFVAYQAILVVGIMLMEVAESTAKGTQHRGAEVRDQQVRCASELRVSTRVPRSLRRRRRSGALSAPGFSDTRSIGPVANIPELRDSQARRACLACSALRLEAGGI